MKMGAVHTYLTREVIERRRKEAEAARPNDTCVLCGWDGWCYRYRPPKSKKDADTLMGDGFSGAMTKVCPNCWQAARGRGKFNQSQTYGNEGEVTKAQMVARERLSRTMERITYDD